MKRNNKRSINKNNDELFIKDLLNNNPDISLAQKIMEQAKKTEKPSIVFDQNNYYKIPLNNC